MRFLGNTYSISNSMFFFRLFQQRTECLVEAAQNNVCKGCRGLPADIPSSYWGASRLGLHATAERGVTAYVLGGTTDWIDNYVQIRPVAPNKCSHLTTSVQKSTQSSVLYSQNMRLSDLTKPKKKKGRPKHSCSGKYHKSASMACGTAAAAFISAISSLLASSRMRACHAAISASSLAFFSASAAACRAASLRSRTCHLAQFQSMMSFVGRVLYKAYARLENT